MKPFCLLFAACCVALSASAALAQGIILPRPCPPQPLPRCAPPEWQQPLRVKSIQISTKINEQAAVTHVEQVFENESPLTIEGTYFFPLPDNVSISEFAMWDGDKRLVGEVRSRDEARRIYNEIVRTRRDPALLEYAGKNLFQASVFPIAPHSEKKIELTYSQVLRNENGTVAYRYPLGTGWRANGIVADWPPPRPMPRPPIRREFEAPTQDRDSVQKRYPDGLRVSAMIEIISRTPLKNIYSPTHELDLKRDGERRTRVSFESRAATSERDFQLFYTLSEQDIGLSLLTYREPGKEGYFLLLAAPKAQLDEREIAAKEVIFVLDTSGSMADDGKMDKAKAALRYGVNALSPRDRFNIVSFAGEEHLLSERPLAADEKGKQEAGEFIAKMRAAGGTNINDALLAACKQLQQSERPQMIILITDGQPTVGTVTASKILANAKEALRAGARLFTFGVGYDVNTVLLDGLANENRGAVDYIEPKEDLEVKVSNFFAKVNHPVLSDVKIDWGGVQTELVYPRTLGDIFHGSQLVLAGRYRPQRTARLTLSGKVNGRERRFVYENLEFADRRTEYDFLPQLWAMRRVGHLLDQIKLNGESKELRDEVIELGTRYGIVTPYTSYLVLEPGMRLQSMGGMERSEQRQRPKVSGGALPNRAYEKPAEAPVAGRDAVVASKRKESLSKADKISVSSEAEAAETSKTMRQVAGKTFYLLDGVWTDSEFQAAAKLPEVSLKFASDDYFKLLGQEPQLGDFLALGQRVVVVWQGKVYRVTE